MMFQAQGELGMILDTSEPTGVCSLIYLCDEHPARYSWGTCYVFVTVSGDFSFSREVGEVPRYLRRLERERIVRK